MNNPNPHLVTNQRQPLKGDEVALPEEEAMALEIAAAAATAAQLVPSFFFSKGQEIGKISQQINGLGDENNKLREKLKTYKKTNKEMNVKIGTLETRNSKQEETIRALETSQGKLQKELEIVKKAKDQLRVEIEEKSSKSSAENKILTEKLDALTKELEVVENENKELEHSLEELKNSNTVLKETVDAISNENQKLKFDMSNLKAEHESFKEKLKCKETRLALGQVAWLLEAEIWDAVLPNEPRGYTRIFNSMERWLKKNSEKEEGKAAQKRWDDLKEKLHWDANDHKPALKILKDLRTKDAHPTAVDLEVARKELNEGKYVAESEKKSCEELIDMITTAKKLNSKQ